MTQTQRRTWLCSIFFSFAMLHSQQALNATVYEVVPFSINNLSLVSGTIETDGTIGSLVPSNISQYSITITDGIESVTLAGSSSEIIGIVEASATSITIPVPANGLFANFNIPSRMPFVTSVTWQVDNEFKQNGYLLRLNSTIESLFTQPEHPLLIAYTVPEPISMALAIMAIFLLSVGVRFG